MSGSQHSTGRRPRVRKREFEEAAALRAALRRFLRESESSTRESGLTVEQYELLLLIKTANESATTVGELHRALARRQSGVTQLVRRVENLGLVSRELSDPRRTRPTPAPDRGRRTPARTHRRPASQGARPTARDRRGDRPQLSSSRRSASPISVTI